MYANSWSFCFYHYHMLWSVFGQINNYTMTLTSGIELFSMAPHDIDDDRTWYSACFINRLIGFQSWFLCDENIIRTACRRLIRVLDGSNTVLLETWEGFVFLDFRFGMSDDISFLFMTIWVHSCGHVWQNIKYAFLIGKHNSKHFLCMPVYMTRRDGYFNFYYIKI